MGNPTCTIIMEIVEVLMNVRKQPSLSQQSFSTKMMLSGIFGMSPLIALECICSEFLDISYKTATRKANLNELPFPAFRLGESQKAKWVVNIDDLAMYIDKESERARADWLSVQV